MPNLTVAVVNPLPICNQDRKGQRRLHRHPREGGQHRLPDGHEQDHFRHDRDAEPRSVQLRHNPAQAEHARARQRLLGRRARLRVRHLLLQLLFRVSADAQGGHRRPVPRQDRVQ